MSLHFDQVLHQHSSSDSKLQIAYCKLLPLYSTCMQRSYSTLPGLAAAVCSYRSDICDTSLPALEASVVADHILQFSRMLSTLSPIAPDEDNPTVAAIDVTFITARVGIYNLPAIWGPATRLEFGITPLLRMSPHCSQPSAGISSLLPADQPAGFPSSSTSPSVAVAPRIPPVTSAATPTTSGLLPASHVSPSVAGMARKIVGDAGDVFSAAGHTQEDVSGAAGVAQRDTWGVARGTEASDVTMEVVGGAGGASQLGEASGALADEANASADAAETVRDAAGTSIVTPTAEGNVEDAKGGPDAVGVAAEVISRTRAVAAVAGGEQNSADCED